MTYMFFNGSLQPFSRLCHHHLLYAIHLQHLTTTPSQHLPVLLFPETPESWPLSLPSTPHLHGHSAGMLQSAPMGLQVHGSILPCPQEPQFAWFFAHKEPFVLSWWDLMFLVAVIVLDVCKPYKSAWRNSWDIFLFTVGAAVYTAINFTIENPYVVPLASRHLLKKAFPILFVISSFLPLYGVCLLCYQIFLLIVKIIPSRYLRLFVQRREKIFQSSFSHAETEYERSLLLASS